MLPQRKEGESGGERVRGREGETKGKKENNLKIEKLNME